MTTHIYTFSGKCSQCGAPLSRRQHASSHLSIQHRDLDGDTSCQGYALWEKIEPAPATPPKQEEYDLQTMSNTIKALALCREEHMREFDRQHTRIRALEHTPLASRLEATEKRISYLLERVEQLNVRVEDVTSLCNKIAQARAEPASLRDVHHTRDVIARIATERYKQKSQWGDDHDDKHELGELACAAACIAVQNDQLRTTKSSSIWPSNWTWKKRGRVQSLIVAAALLVAEIERRERAPLSKDSNPA